MIFTEKEVEYLIHNALNQGMSIRQNQLQGYGPDRSAREILNEWWVIIKNKKNAGLDVTK